MKTREKKDAVNRKKWTNLVLGLLLMMCLGTVYSWSIFRIPLENKFNIGATESGIPYMASLVFYALFMLITGKYLDKFNPRMIILVGGMLVAMGWILSSFASSLFYLVVTYGVLMGAGVGIVYGVPLLIAAKWFPEKKGFALGVVLTGFGLSPIITAPIANYLVTIYGVMKTFLILGVSFAVLIPLLSLPMSLPLKWGGLADKKVENNTLREFNTAKMIKSKNFIALYICFLFGTIIGLMLIGLTSNVGLNLIKLTTDKVALAISLFAVFGGVGRPVFGWLTDKFSIKKSMLISYTLIIIGAMLMLMARDGQVRLFIIAFSLFWFNLGGWLAIAPVTTLKLFGSKHYGQNYGVVFTAYGMGAIIGVLSSGLLTDVYQNYDLTFYLVIGICILGISVSQLMVKV